MGNGVLRQKWRLQPDFGADPFALQMRGVRGMFAFFVAAKLRSKGSTLNLIELANLAPGGIADGAGDVNL